MNYSCLFSAPVSGALWLTEWMLRDNQLQYYEVIVVNSLALVERVNKGPGIVDINTNIKRDFITFCMSVEYQYHV